MTLFGWLKRGSTPPALREWHEAWERAVAALDALAPERLAARLTGLGEDVEIEEEMLQALRDVLALERDLATGQLPEVETSHRVTAGEPCHYSAPVSMPDDPSQPTGRLLLTSHRAAFAGPGRVPAVPWHAARGVMRAGRDIVLVRAGTDDGQRFRCNSFSDALCAAAIARHLMRGVRKPL